MADLSDCEIALREAVQAVRSTLGGTSALPGAVPALAGVPVYRGWPAPAALDAALTSGKPVVTVYARPGYSRTTTRFPNDEVELPRAAPTVSVTVSGNVATFAGTGGPAQLAGVQVGTTAYSVRAPGTPADTAAALAAIVPGASATGAALTVAGLAAARTGADGATLRPTRQLQQGLAVIVWAADPAQRDTVCAAIDGALSEIDFLPLPDGSRGRLTYAGTTASDKAENAGLYRRDLNLVVEYSITVRTARTPVLFEGQVLRPGVAAGPAANPPGFGEATVAVTAQTTGFAGTATIRVGALAP